MPISQERMMALCDEIKMLRDEREQALEILKMQSATGEWVNPELMALLRRPDTPCYYLETNHFRTHAKANMRRALKLRMERDSQCTRPLLANVSQGQADAARKQTLARLDGAPKQSEYEQMIAKAAALVDAEHAAKGHAQSPIASFSPQVQGFSDADFDQEFYNIYDELRIEHPDWDAVKLTNEAKILKLIGKSIF